MTAISFDNSYARLPEVFFARVQPNKAPNPNMIRLNTDLAETMGLDINWLSSEKGLSMLSGRKLPSGAEPISMAYAGNQFGNWLTKLGDGRALLLGEVVSPDGIRRDLQLKGSGKTPFSRGGDGKAALGSVLREYIVSEAMAALGVPTTRALAAIITGETVDRDNEQQPGAVFVRVAQSHVRIGTFQYFHGRMNNEALKILADYVIDRHYPDIKQDKQPYKALLKEVIKRQAELVAQWMSFGFIHGVMNTDNMQVVGETIDYGPCAYMDDFHPHKSFSSIDRESRYAWDNQPAMALWNLTRLAEALEPLLAEEQAIKEAEEALATFDGIFSAFLLKLFHQKLGLLDAQIPHNSFIEKTFEVMTENEVDFTLFFRHLTRVVAGETKDALYDLFKNPKAGYEWLKTWQEYVLKDGANQEERVAVMRKRNPIFIPRNHRVEEAIQAGLIGDFKPFNRLVDVLKNPFEEQPDHADLEDSPKAEEVVCQTFCGT